MPPCLYALLPTHTWAIGSPSDTGSLSLWYDLRSSSAGLSENQPGLASRHRTWILPGAKHELGSSSQVVLQIGLSFVDVRLPPSAYFVQWIAVPRRELPVGYPQHCPCHYDLPVISYDKTLIPRRYLLVSTHLMYPTLCLSLPAINSGLLLPPQSGHHLLSSISLLNPTI